MKLRLEQVFQDNSFIEHRKLSLNESDIKYFLHRLQKGRGVYDVLQYIAVVEELPSELLLPIINKILEYKDVSGPKKYMEEITRVFTPENVQDTVLKIMVESNDYLLKCKVAGILYCIGVRCIVNKLNQDLTTEFKMAVDYIWNGKKYELQPVDNDIKSNEERVVTFLYERQKVLISEFLKSKNIIYKYHLSLNLSHNIEGYSSSILFDAKQVVEEITRNEFPKSAKTLIEMIKGNEELENLLYDKLNWNKI